MSGADTQTAAIASKRRRFGLRSLISRRPAVAGLISFAVIVAVWEFVWATHLVERGLVPSPQQVFERFWVLLTKHGLIFDMYMSSYRVLMGVLFGILFAVPVGFALGWYRPIRAFADPVINFFRALPPIALIPLVIVYFGIGEFAKISLLFYAAFFSGVIVMYEGIKSVNPTYVRVARVLGADDSEIFLKVIVPVTLPHALTAVRVAMGVAWTALVAAELVAAQRGLGAVIVDGQNYFQVDTIYVGIILIGTVALTMDKVLRALSARLVAWQETLS